MERNPNAAVRDAVNTELRRSCLTLITAPLLAWLETAGPNPLLAWLETAGPNPLLAWLETAGPNPLLATGPLGIARKITILGKSRFRTANTLGLAGALITIGISGCAPAPIGPGLEGNEPSPTPSNDTTPTPIPEPPHVLGTVGLTNAYGGISVVGDPNASSLEVQISCSGGEPGACDQVGTATKAEDDWAEVSVSTPENATGLEVDLSATLPTGALVSAKTRSGDISFATLDGGIAAAAEEGNVSGTDLIGDTVVEVMYGNVDLDLRMEPNGLVQVVVGDKVSEGAGDIYLTLPYNSSTNLSAQTLSGKITLIDIVGVWNWQTKASGTMGDGDGVIYLFTTSGNITIYGEGKP